MVWQVVAMWAIVIATIIWFVRDERRLRRDAVLARAAAYYAHAPKYRHVGVEPAEQPVAAPTQRVGGLSRSQRDYLEGLVANN